MTVLALIATYATYVVVWSWYAAQLVSVLLGLWALLDAAVPMMIRYGYKRLGLEFPEPRRRASDWEETEEDNAGE